MAIKDITARGEWITFTDEDTMGFTAVVTVSRDDLSKLLAASDAAQPAPAACPFCHDRAKHDAEWQAICDNGMREQQKREDRRNRSIDREEAANRRREMRQDMRNSYAR
jgi:nitroreductase